MITGTVTADREAIVPLEVVGPAGQGQRVEAVVDTGFTGSLTLPSSVITALGLPWMGRGRGILADGSVQLFDVYRVTVIWDTLPRSVEVEATETQPLLGMALLEGHELKMQVTSGGTVSITPLP